MSNREWIDLLPKDELKDVFLHGGSHAGMSIFPIDPQDTVSSFDMKGVNNMCYIVQVAIYHTRNNVYHDKQYFNTYTDAKAHFDKLSEHLRTKQERHEIETWDMRISPYKGF